MIFIGITLKYPLAHIPPWRGRIMKRRGNGHVVVVLVVVVQESVIYCIPAHEGKVLAFNGVGSCPEHKLSSTLDYAEGTF